MRRLLPLILACISALTLAVGQAHAAGGTYVIDGATAKEQAQVRAALNASSFDWSLVRANVAIHVRRDLPTSYSSPGQIWLDANLLDSGRFSWGVVQMEYGQQVHFFLLDDAERATMTSTLGAKEWCYEQPGTTLADNGCERFAATLAWAYWQSADNVMRPAGSSDISASLSPPKFKALIAQMLTTPSS